MCFYHDYDWTAEVSERSTITVPEAGRARCDECGCTIPPGAVAHSLYQQQYEECHRCAGYDSDGCECPKDKDGDCIECQCPEPVYGETFEYTCCDECDKFLLAVEYAEVEAGCDRSEARPSLCGMIEDIRGGGMDEAKKYWKAARRMFPELVASGYLGRLWRRVFG